MSDYSALAQRLVQRSSPKGVLDPRAIYQQMSGNRFAKYRDDPVGFAVDVLRLSMWEGLEHILTAILEHDRVAIRAGRKVSKSTGFAAASWWWMLARQGRVFMTSSSFAQIKGVLWYELRRLATVGNLGVDIAKDPSTGVWQGLAGIVGRSTDTPENMQGYSGADVLYLPDEASGIADEIIDAIVGNCAGGGKIAMAGNPTRTTGRYFDIFRNPKSWYTLHLDSENSPNVLAKRVLIPGLASYEWVQEMREEWGEDSPLYQVHVKGNFAEQNDNTVIGLALVETAQKQHPDEPLPPPTKYGVDVARFGDDDSAVQPLSGHHAWPQVTLQSMDGVEVAGHVMNLVEKLSAGQAVEVNVDVIGYGSSCYDHLLHSERAKALKITPHPVNVAESATAEGYSKLRDQLWFGVKHWLQEGGTLPNDPKLQAELVAPTYSFDSQGRHKVQSKDDMKKQKNLKRSPDRADALALAVYRYVPKQAKLPSIHIPT